MLLLYREIPKLPYFFSRNMPATSERNIGKGRGASACFHLFWLWVKTALYLGKLLRCFKGGSIVDFKLIYLLHLSYLYNFKIILVLLHFLLFFFFFRSFLLAIISGYNYSRLRCFSVSNFFSHWDDNIGYVALTFSALTWHARICHIANTARP